MTQDLGKAAAKLQVMLKKTQTALNTEKETVAKLKMQNGAAKEVVSRRHSDSRAKIIHSL